MALDGSQTSSDGSGWLWTAGLQTFSGQFPMVLDGLHTFSDGSGWPHIDGSGWHSRGPDSFEGI